MENNKSLQYQQANILQVGNRKLTPKEINIALTIADINMILAYPLNDNQIEQWAHTIERLRPHWDVEKLEKIVDSFISGDREWQVNKGISNIFLAESKSTLNF